MYTAVTAKTTVSAHATAVPMRHPFPELELVEAAGAVAPDMPVSDCPKVGVVPDAWYGSVDTVGACWEEGMCGPGAGAACWAGKPC